MGDPLTITNAARAYLLAGLCALPAIRAEKRPAVGRWKQYQRRLPTEAEVSTWFANTPDAICILCGQASGNTEIIDFDAGGELFSAWWQCVPADLRDRLVVERTPSGGWHVIYRSHVPIRGNMKLAQRRDGPKVVTLIETRGEGGLFLCAPTPGYDITQGDLCDLPMLTEAERDTLLQTAWELNEYVPPVLNGPPDAADVGQRGASSARQRSMSAKSANIGDCPTDSGHHAPITADRPGDDFNIRGDVRAMLEQHGWVRLSDRQGRDGNEYWRRPGKDSGWSATLKDRVFYVFSSNASPFEPNQAYAPFSVYALLEHGGDFEQAARSLRELGFGGDYPTDNGTSVDISGILATVGEYPPEDTEDREDAPAIADPGPLPAEMLRVPGFVNEVMDHTMAIAPYPSQVMAFAGALSLLACLAGRKVRDPGDNRTNIYLLGLAHSSAGKDYPRKVTTRILHQIGLAKCLGEHFASGEAIQDALFQAPSMLFQTDEIDGMLESINKAKDARHEAIMSTLLTMYSSANSVFPMRRKAGKEFPGVIDQPNLVIFGTAIPNHYYKALSERMLTNGFFARMIILEAGPRGPGQEPSIGDPPPRVLATAKWWADYRPGTGNLEEWHPIPTIVEHSDEAKRLLIETRLEAEAEYSKAEQACDSVGTTVWGRVSEQVRKLALLYAVSENHEAPRIGLAAVEWASRVIMHQTRRMLFMAAAHVADGEFDALIKRAIGILRQWHEKRGHDALMPTWELRRRLKQRPSDFKDIVFELAERQIARLDTEKGKTKPKSGYRLL